MSTLDNRRHLMEAALALFAQEGYHKTKVSDIVKQVGVAQGTFYWHFKNKEEIVLCILQEGEQALLNVIRSGYRQTEGNVDDMVESSRRLMTDLFSFAQANPDYMRLLFKTGQDAEEKICRHISHTLIAIEEAFERNIKRAQELEMLPKDSSSKRLAAMLVSLVLGTLERWLFSESPHLDNIAAESLAVEIVSFEFFGLLGKTK
ncbi:TetR/AcrR family transcriptional regulator [Shouchella clausii]|uniref:HTH tetR-type domain-containing protein n=2 Tax=Shouchella TaxID=2893057 RepID=Q5WHL0_SHOC1|nr:MULTISPECIES: TetR/AcrR family transcriptional regulator [Shouchella]MCM3312378.1 TetR/AcrR family transcriptional regulator [Psychrobacillus sp. MER TA 17]ALA51233.1 Transcription repressor of multidrug efflux pump acrAB operon, TetR (AcrR) family [Shouchella clausii]MCM3379064.1 TetR/AcrR family transcriptional regulator [Shouchella rhizosphaerae]MDP0464416.1 TetR/AcrR family transcriptional regulator [Shouchella rhizosphaerae]MDP5258092.1 TetR/AcrR family transcriptional regulator [Shouc